MLITPTCWRSLLLEQGRGEFNVAPLCSLQFGRVKGCNFPPSDDWKLQSSDRTIEILNSIDCQ